MSVKILGLDWFDVVVHVVVTIAIGIAVESVFPHPLKDAGLGVVLAASAVVLGWRRKRAMTLDPTPVPGHVAELDGRMAELEAQQNRLVELEERLDFVERMLTRQREVPSLGPGTER